MTIDISQFYKVFFDEAEELLAEKERLLLAVDIDAPDPEDLNAIFRTAHSIKGGASTFGLNDMSAVRERLSSGLADRIQAIVELSGNLAWVEIGLLAALVFGWILFKNRRTSKG